MAEYYPLLAKAVASLPNSTPETRHTVYERARKALLGQLRALQPPVPEADIEKENQALDSAVARLEAEFASAAPASAGANETAIMPVPDAGINAPSPPLAPEPPQKPAETPAEEKRARVPKGALTLQSKNLEGKGSDEAKPAAAKGLSSPAGPVLPIAAAEIPVTPAAKLRPDPQRPVAPQPSAGKPNAKGLWIVLVVIGLIVAGVAVTAWKLRDRPEDLAKLKSAQPQQSEASGKIVGRVGETVPAKDTASSTAQSAAADASTNVPVTYRAALLVQAPEEQNKVKTYFGTVLWRLDNVSNGPGEPLGTAIHANIDIPEDKLQASVTLQKNVDASLPASHTMTIVFSIQPATPTGGIKQIGLPQMRKEDSANGEALSGLPVPIMENSFLIGLTKGTSEAMNLDLLKTRQWIDIPILLTNGRIAKLTFEKGVAGQRAVEDAFASWQAQ